MSRVNIHIYPSPIQNEARIFKITDWLQSTSTFDKILIIGIQQQGLAKVERRGRKGIILRLPGLATKSDFLPIRLFKFIFWSFQILITAQRFRPKCINAHSLSVLPIATMISRLFCTDLVYDTHELETEVKSAIGLRKYMMKAVERSLIHLVDRVIVVSDSIADWYAHSYSIKRPDVIRNIPTKIADISYETNYLREKFTIAESASIALYLGALAPGRNVEIAIRAWENAPSNWHLVIIGFGSLAKQLEAQAEHMNNVHFHPAVDPNQVVQIAASADIGLTLLDQSCLSHDFALPNKFFEYLTAGIPIFTTPLPEMTKIINKFNCGWVGSLSDLPKIFRITSSELRIARARIEEVRPVYTWKNEKRILHHVYKELGYVGLAEDSR